MRKSLERIRRMAIKELIQIRRNPRMKSVIFAIPIVQTLIFGYAVTTEVKNAKTAVYDRDHSIESRNLISRFTSSGNFRITQYPATDAQVQELVDKSRVQAVIRIDRGFAEAIRGGHVAQVQLILDGTDSNTSRIIMSYAARIVADYSRAVRVSAARKAGIESPPVALVSLATRAWFNENLESRIYYVPGIIALLVTLVTLLLSGMAVVREREIGTMEQIIVTPIRQYEFVLGKMVPFVAIAFFDVILITVIGALWFDVPIRGSLFLLFGVTAIYLMSTLGIGLLISTVSSTQQQALMTDFFFFLPAVLLSGFVFPIASMPVVVQWLTYLNPMRYFLVIVRGIFLKGAGVAILWPQILALVILGIAAVTAAMSRFKKTLA